MSPSPVPFMDLSWQWRAIAADVMPELNELFERSSFVLGPYVARFEEAFAAYIGAKHAIGVNSGTSALHLALLALDIGPGDGVIVPASTFIASAWGVAYVGATPVFCDVDPRSANIDLADAERRLTPAVKAVIPVHLYGQPADIDRVRQFADRHGLQIIEDAAQAHGARWGNRRVGTFGRMGCFSFYPGKNLGAAGEAGMIVTDDDALAARLRCLRDHGQRERYVHAEIGYNYRMEGVQGVVLWHKLRRLDEWTALRRQLAQRYLEALSDLPLTLPRPVAGDHVFHLFVVLVAERDRLRAHLRERGIETGLHYPVPLHRQACFAHLPLDRDSFPVADRYADQGLSLPLFPGMTVAQQDGVIGAVRDFHEARQARAVGA